MQKILKLTVILFIVCAIVAGVLGVINELTKDRIAEQNRLKTEKAYAAVLVADSYEAVDFDAAAFPTVDSISKAGEAGHVVETTFSGAQGSITMAVGVDTELKITGISIIKHAETAGLGAVAAATTSAGETFRGNFVGKSGIVSVTKDGGEIDSITGATITSRAVCAGVNAALDCVAGMG